MAETSSTITRHHLCTRLKEHSTLWAGNDGAVVDGTFFTIEIRVGFNWAEYWIDGSTTPQSRRLAPTWQCG